MPRTVKSPEERRSELIAVAQKLFYTKGYEQTSVSDIVKAVGVAQGTFYYHFGSKADILEAVVIQIIDKQAELARPIVYSESLSPLEKLNVLVGQNNRWKIEHRAEIFQLARGLLNDDNVLMEKKAIAYRRIVYGEMCTVIIEEGIQDGSFQVKYAQESADLLLVVSRHLSRDLFDLLLADDDPAARCDTAHRLIETANVVFASILGMPADFSLVNPALIDEWFEQD